MQLSGESEEEEVEELVVVEATDIKRFLAWSLDLSILVLSMVVSIISIFYFAELPFEALGTLMISDYIFINLGFLGLLFYIFYFSFLDKTSYSTLGKNIMGIKLVSSNVDRERISLIQSFSRTVFTIISFVLLGLPAILKIHDKIFDTKVILK
jgi:uncharacterized RDD family membrane protein YckC